MEKEKQVELLHKTINGVLKAFANSIKDGSDFIPVDSYVPENFYKGTEKFLKNPSKNGKWSLGYANVNLTPVDYAKRAYYMGGYISHDFAMCVSLYDTNGDIRANHPFQYAGNNPQ